MATIADDRPWRAKWQIKRMLGQGGQGTAHLVSSIAEPDQAGVLKRLRWRTSPKARARMHREVTILDTLAHQGLKVPRVLDSNIDRYLDGDIPLYFVMEFIPGQTLEEEVRARGPLELNKAGSLVHALAEIVSAAHRERVIHRDLKPNNILVRDFEKNDVVIVDYGLSFNAADETGTLTDPGEQSAQPLSFAARGEYAWWGSPRWQKRHYRRVCHPLLLFDGALPWSAARQQRPRDPPQRRVLG